MTVRPHTKSPLCYDEKNSSCVNRGVSEALPMPAKRHNVKSAAKRRRVASPLTVDRQGRDFLTEAEMQRFLDAARHGRHGVRDYLLLLLTYRHGLRVSEAIDLRLKDFDLGTPR